MVQDPSNLPKKMEKEVCGITVEDFVSRSLRWGIVVSIAIVAFGLVLFLVTGNSGYPMGAFPTSISQVMNGLSDLKPFAIINLGLLLLIATPILGVIVSVIAFIINKDPTFALISVFVLAVLIISLLLGKAE